MEYSAATKCVPSFIFDPAQTRLAEAHFPVYSFSGVNDAPDRTRAIVAHEQGAVRRDGKAHGPPPDAFVVDHKPGEKVLVLSSRMPSLVQRHANDFICGA